MNRKDISPQHIEDILEIAANTIFAPGFIEAISFNVIEFRCIHAMLWMTPLDIAQVFHYGNLPWEVAKLSALGWQWEVTDPGGRLQVKFYKNIANKSEADLHAERELNRQVAEYLARATK